MCWKSLVMWWRGRRSRSKSKYHKFGSKRKHADEDILRELEEDEDEDYDNQALLQLPNYDNGMNV
eukprot:m.100433 g.100433  ORF g.100433 m.100433 type:complete len:65 (+) comp13707_c0_seq1:232-426(+)